jgi:hypothetical protein
MKRFLSLKRCVSKKSTERTGEAKYKADAQLQAKRKRAGTLVLYLFLERENAVSVELLWAVARMANYSRQNTRIVKKK